MTRQVDGNPMKITDWNSASLFSNLRKTFFARKISAIIPIVYNLISKIVLVKMLLIMVRMIKIWKSLTKRLILLNRYLFPCSLKVRLGRSISSKLHEIQLPTKTFLIHTDTSSRRYYFQTKDSTQNRSALQIQKFSTKPTSIVNHLMKFTSLMWFYGRSWNINTLIWKVSSC